MWSSEGTPLKRQEHVQFTEFLSMDRFKHNSSMQNHRRITCAPTAPRAESLNNSTLIPKANGTGGFNKSAVLMSFMLWFLASHILLNCLPGIENNNKPFSNGTCSSVFIHPPGLNSQLGVTYDFR